MPTFYEYPVSKRYETKMKNNNFIAGFKCGLAKPMLILVYEWIITCNRTLYVVAYSCHNIG